jgi:hypothetical protein
VAKPAASGTTTGAVSVSSETMTGLFKGAFPKRIADRCGEVMSRVLRPGHRRDQHQ